MSVMDRLRVLFDEIGSYQLAIDEGTPFSQCRPEIYNRIFEVYILLPPGNEHIWNDFRMWIMQGWATAQQRGGDAEAEPWRAFMAEVRELLGPGPD